VSIDLDQDHSTKQILAGAQSHNRKIALGLQFLAPLIFAAEKVIG
jgi:hypothetical protein